MNVLNGIRFGAEITAAASAHGLDPRLLAGVAAQETGGPGTSSGNNIVGDSGHGHGLFQIDDRSYAFARTSAAMDPAASANMAAQILSNNLQRYGGDVKAALSAYNTGRPTATGTKTTWGDGKTLGYADSVLRHVSELGGASGALAAETPYTRADVNVLANLGAQTPLSSALATSTAPQLDPMLGSAAGSSSSGSQFSPVVTWASMTGGHNGSGGAQAGSAADKGMADILDQVSVFDGSDGDSSDD